MKQPLISETELFSITHYSEQVVQPIGHLLEWNELTRTVPNRPYPVLNQVSGKALPGELLGIIGPSGAGKTTLLECLARPSPEVFLNGTSTADIDYLSLTSVVAHDDALLSTLTPWELLKFSLDLRTQCPEADKRDKVESLLNELQLTEVAHTGIGDFLDRGLSGGEKKRALLGAELIVDPPVFILDEPTSGVDSVTALLLVTLLKAHAAKGNTVIMTIHQPSLRTFSQIDRLLLLCNGSAVYQGPTAEVQSHFEQLGFPFPEYVNPADMLTSLLFVADSNNLTETERSRLQRMQEAYVDTKPPTKKYALKLTVQPSSLTKTCCLLNRGLKNAWRHPAMAKFRIFQSLFLTTLVSIFFNHLNPASFQTTNGVLFLTTGAQISMACEGSILACKLYAVPNERSVYFKENKRGYYSSLPYYLSKSVVELPIQVFSGLIYALGVYWIVGLNNHSPVNFLVFGIAHLATVVIACQVCGTGYGYLTGILFADATTAAAATPFTVGLLVLFAGFFSSQPNLPWVITLIQYISPFRYAFEALAINQYSGLNAEALRLLDMDGTSVWEPLAYLFTLTVVVRVLAWLILAYKSF